MATVPDFEVPFVPILEEGRKDWALSNDLKKHDWWLSPSVRFSGTQDLRDKFSSHVIAPAEAKFLRIRSLKAERLLAEDGQP
jgi:hypothetical protein